MRRSIAVLVLALVACSGQGGSTTVTIGEGASDPVAAIEDLQSLLAQGDFGAAGSLSVPGHAVLASLGEGATPSTVAASLEDGDGEVAANFWNGFAQGVGQTFAEEVTVEDLGTTSEEGVEFFVVGVTPEGGDQRLMVTRDVDGQRVDLFATFGAGLAEGMMGPVELLLGSSNEDSQLILSALQDVVPSLLVAANDESLSPDSVQRILQLVELITRVG
ncbi:MAG TPA: hypothetical protein VNT92_02530 [Acidimicrobiia bacterium]|nr:hypothetical protein [Acidimicrobiia bacterium]